MTKEVLATELLSMQNRAERMAQNIDQILCNLLAKKQSLRQMIKEYSAKRVELIKLELEARGMTWCTHCFKTIPEDKAGLMLFEGAEERSGGYENSCWGCHSFSNLHRVCSDCREKAQNKHGTQGRYDHFNDIQACFYAFRVEKRENGYYAYKFGNWAKLDEKKCTFDELSSWYAERLVEGWDIPPRIEIDYRNDKLVIYKRVATAKAV